jgi:hypothetical protein
MRVCTHDSIDCRFGVSLNKPPILTHQEREREQRVRSIGYITQTDSLLAQQQQQHWCIVAVRRFAVAVAVAVADQWRCIGLVLLVRIW